MSPNTSAPTNVIWNATRMFSAPDAEEHEDHRRRASRARSHAGAPHHREQRARPRRGAARRRAPGTACSCAGRRATHISRYTRIGSVVQCWKCARNRSPTLPAGARRQEVPVVLGEPAVAAPMQQQRKRDDRNRRETDRRRARALLQFGAEAAGRRQLRLVPLHRAMTVRCPTIPPTPQRQRAFSISHGQPSFDGRRRAKRLPSRPGGGSRQTHSD